MAGLQFVTMRRALLVFAVIFLIVAVIYRPVPISFLRAESGWFLCLAQSDEAIQRPVVRGFFTDSYAGHYTPIAFWSEFTLAKIVGTSRTFWRWRQLVAVSAVGAVLFGLTVGICGLLGLPRPQQLAIAAALTAIILFQPAMVDFVTWPFMILQLSWLGLSFGALFCLIKTLSHPGRPHWAWIAAGAAYASLHVSGLGLVTVAATVAVLSWFGFNGDHAMRRRTFSVSAVVIVLGLVHAAMMVQPLTASSGLRESTSVLAALKYSFGFIFNFAISGLLSFTLISRNLPDVHSIEYCWPLGLLLVVFAIVGLALHLRRARRESTLPSQITTMLLLFSGVGFGVMMALITARQLSSVDASVTMPYLLVTPRYIIPLQFLFVGLLVLALAGLARRLPRFVLIGCCAVVATVMVTQHAYQRNGMAFLTAGTRASHYTCWRLLLAATQECRAAALPLPNFSMAPLTVEFSEADVKTFLPLLHHDLRLPHDEKIELISLEDYRAGDPERYRAAPSVKVFKQKLELAGN
jgi:hypothetical protein